MKRVALGAALLLAPLPALAQPPAAAPATAPDRGPIDPARLDIARSIVARILPKGGYRQMMSGVMDQIGGNMSSSLANMSLADLASAGGASRADVARLDKATLGEVMAIMDPYFKERSERTSRAMLGEMMKLFDGYEPQLREATARAYARTFSLDQLKDIDTFFSSPSGSFYAAHVMSIATDPEIMGAMQTVMPDMMKHLPEWVKAAQDATKDLPPPRKYKDLSAAEKDQLAKLMGLKKDGK